MNLVSMRAVYSCEPSWRDVLRTLPWYRRVVWRLAPPPWRTWWHLWRPELS